MSVGQLPFAWLDHILLHLTETSRQTDRQTDTQTHMHKKKTLQRKSPPPEGNPNFMMISSGNLNSLFLRHWIVERLLRKQTRPNVNIQSYFKWVERTIVSSAIDVIITFSKTFSGERYLNSSSNLMILKATLKESNKQRLHQQMLQQSLREIQVSHSMLEDYKTRPLFRWIEKNKSNRHWNWLEVCQINNPNFIRFPNNSNDKTNG